MSAFAYIHIYQTVIWQGNYVNFAETWMNNLDFVILYKWAINYGVLQCMCKVKKHIIFSTHKTSRLKY